MLIWHHSFHSSRGSSSCAQERKLNQPSMLQETLTILCTFLMTTHVSLFFFFKLNYRFLYPGATFTSSFFFSGLSDLVLQFCLKAMREENADTIPTVCPSLLPPIYLFGKARALQVQLPQWLVMVYFVSKCILVPLCSNLQHKFSSCAIQTSHELTCLQCRAAIVCHTFQIKGSQDRQCLQDTGSCWGLLGTTAGSFVHWEAV